MIADKMYIHGIKINELLRINIKYIKSVDESICCLYSAAGTEMSSVAFEM